MMFSLEYISTSMDNTKKDNGFGYVLRPERMSMNKYGFASHSTQ